MNHISKILAAGTVLLAMASCSHVAEYTSQSFVALGRASFTVQEDVGSFQIPVTVYPTDGKPNTSVTFKINETSAKAGTDFTVEPASGVLAFSADSTQYITVTVKNDVGVFTGDKKFTIELESATNGYTRSNYMTSQVTIKDLDHPLSAILGTYTKAGVADYWGDTYDFAITISPYPDDITKVLVENLDPYFAGNGFTADKGVNVFEGDVSEDMTQIVVAAGQPVGYNDVALDVFNDASPDTATAYSDYLVILVNKDEGTITLTTAWGMYTASGGGYYTLFNGPLVLKK